MTIAEPDFARRHAFARRECLASARLPDAMASRRRSTAPAGAEAPSRAHDNPPNAIMLVLTAALAKVTTSASAKRPADGIRGDRPEHQNVRGQHQQQAPQHRPLAQASGFPLQVEQQPAPRRESFDGPRRPARTAAVPWPRAGRRPGGRRNRRGAAPRELRPCCDRARWRSRAAANAWRARLRRAAAAPTRRRPPAPAADANPPTSSTRPDAMKSIEMDNGGPLMPRSKSRAMVRSVVRRGSSRCPMPGGPTQAAVSSS